MVAWEKQSLSKYLQNLIMQYRNLARNQRILFKVFAHKLPNTHATTSSFDYLYYHFWTNPIRSGEKSQSMKSGSFKSLKLDLEKTCSSLNICKYFQIEIMPPPKYESHHRSSCLSNFCWEVAQTWIILDPVFSFMRKKKIWLNKNLPWKTELLYFSDNLIFLLFSKWVD